MSLLEEAYMQQVWDLLLMPCWVVQGYVPQCESLNIVTEIYVSVLNDMQWWI